MSDILDSVENLPDISFIDNMTLTDVQTKLVNWFNTFYEQITGKRIRLARGDPYRIILLSCAQVLYQGMEQVDRAAKMNFIKYSYGDFLRHLAAFKKVFENEPQKATAKVTWKLAQARESATSIPAGSRVTADYESYFETTEYAEIPAGETEITLLMYCTEAGTKGNGYMAGEVNVIVDPVPFIDSAANTETTAGGTDEESDESIKERTYLAPSSFSTAGPDDAYIYHAKTYSQDVGDVKPSSPTPGVVDIRFIMQDGSIPTDAQIAGMKEHLAQRSKRPLTDNVTVAAPDIVKYDTNIKYFINSSDTNAAVQIQKQAEEAVTSYQTWQCAEIGRDINPDELLSLLKSAGVKRAVITAPEFKVLKNTEVAQAASTTIVYGGIEDD